MTERGAPDTDDLTESIEANASKAATGLVPTNLNEAITMARIFARSVIIPDALRGKPADVFATIMAGVELGLAPMASLRLIFIIKGKPSLSADAMVALALSRGAAEYFICIESTAERATYETKRRGQPKRRMTFQLSQAKTAKLLEKADSNWATYPEAMLRARAKSALARDVYPDVLAGIYTPDELEDGTIDVEVDDVKPPPTEESAPRDPSAEAAVPSDVQGSLDRIAITKETRGIFAEIESMQMPTAPSPNAATLAGLRARIEKLPEGLDRTAALSALARLEKPRKK